jgi:hypothetical protein
MDVLQAAKLHSPQYPQSDDTQNVITLLWNVYLKCELDLPLSLATLNQINI